MIYQVFNIPAPQKCLQTEPTLEFKRWVATGSNSKQMDKYIPQQQMENIMETNENQFIQQVRITENPTSNSKGVGLTKSPTNVDTMIKGETTNVRIIDWVQERFGKYKETLNVTLHHSCEEIPFQTLVESPKPTGATITDKQTWSDDVHDSEFNSESNTSIRVGEQRCNTNTEQAHTTNNLTAIHTITHGENPFNIKGQFVC